MDDFPLIPDLLEYFKNDSAWNEIGESYSFIYKIIGKCAAELFTNVNFTNKRKDIDDFRLYSAHYLLRSGRLFKSIVLLSIYWCIFEAEMLQRPLLENIAETKYFLKCRRARAIRKIDLYQLINDSSFAPLNG